MYEVKKTMGCLLKSANSDFHTNSRENLLSWNISWTDIVLDLAYQMYPLYQLLDNSSNSLIVGKTQWYIVYWRGRQTQHWTPVAESPKQCFPVKICNGLLGVNSCWITSKYGDLGKIYPMNRSRPARRSKCALALKGALVSKCTQHFIPSAQRKPVIGRDYIQHHIKALFEEFDWPGVL